MRLELARSAGFCYGVRRAVQMAEMAAEAVPGTPARRQTYLHTQLKFLTMQVSADSIPTKGGQEDHVEFSYTAALKALKGTELLEKLLSA